MKYLVEAYGVWLEGSEALLQAITRNLVILPIVFPGHYEHVEMLFQEDYFDAASRIRRGRLYRKDHDKSTWDASNVSWFPHVNQLHRANFFYVNYAYRAAEQTVTPGWVAEMGNNDAQSRWIVVFSEKVRLDAHYLTLKSKTYFGVLPEVDPEAIPENNRQDVLQALDAVVQAAPIQAPQPVIDACRNAACHMITAKFPESNSGGKKDLGELVKWLLEEGRLKSCAEAANAVPALLEASASHLINRLHSRAKPNAAAQHGTRPVSQQDANLAVDAVAFLLQDFGWGGADR
ncbi:MAG: hypothetical protein M0Z85_03930 [Gammaproteobacteria bacterium]|nr:hypothetical protein [Gammaproteobacteria bacterium]